MPLRLAAETPRTPNRSPDAERVTVGPTKCLGKLARERIDLLAKLRVVQDRYAVSDGML